MFLTFFLRDFVEWFSCLLYVWKFWKNNKDDTFCGVEIITCTVCHAGKVFDFSRLPSEELQECKGRFILDISIEM